MKPNTPYRCQSNIIPGSSYGKVYKIAFGLFKLIKSKSKRRPYVRSAYFGGKKVFLDNFWPHLNQKRIGDRKRRLRYFECTLELIQKSSIKPIHIFENGLKNEALYRFLGLASRHHFVVQIKKDLKRDQLFLMSAFEYKQK